MQANHRKRFRDASPQQLIDALNGQVGITAWVSARADYLAELKAAFLETGLDCSGFIKDGGMRVIRVRLDGDKVVPVEQTTEPTEESKVFPLAEGAVDLEDRQAVINALIWSMQSGNGLTVKEFGDQFVSRWGDDLQGGEEDGILRPLDDFDDPELVVSLLDPSPSRAEELEDGADLTPKEMSRLADAVAEGCFEDDGHNDAWVISSIANSVGTEAFVAATISGCSWEGIEYTFVGAFPSAGQARAALQRLGYLDGDDFRRRYSRT